MVARGKRLVKTLRLALDLVWQSSPTLSVASLILIVLQGVLPLVTLYFVKLLFDALSIALGQPELTPELGSLLLPIILMGIVSLLGVALSAIAGWVTEAQTQTITDHVHDFLHAKSIVLDLEYYESAEYYDTLHRAQKEAPYRPARIVNGLMQTVQSSVSLLAILALLLSLYWPVVLLLLVMAIPGVLVRLRYANQTFRWLRHYTSEERQSWYYDWMMIDGGHAKELRLFGLGALFSERFRKLRSGLRMEKLRIAQRRVWIDLIANGSMVLAVFGSLALVMERTLHGMLTVGDLVMYYQAFQRGQSLLQELMRGLVGLYEDTLFLSHLEEFLNLQPKVVDPADPKRVARPILKGIVVDHVQFQYPGSARRVLEDISLAITPGEIVALVGPNGSGKTTLVKLLCRLYDPSAGRIALDGLDLREFRTADLRREISVVFQDYLHYNLSAKDNIWFGDITAPPDDARITMAAVQADAHGVITGLKCGYDTTLGRIFQDGEELSVGEWQKIALARAFLRDAQILVLDEPTSALDAVAEHEVFECFRRLAQGRTGILISHRLSTIKMADRIYVLDNGRIAEQGTHEELIAREGTYARLFETQAQKYR